MSQPNLGADSEVHDGTAGKMTPSRVDQRPGLNFFESVCMCSDRPNSPIIDYITEVYKYFAIQGADR